MEKVKCSNCGSRLFDTNDEDEPLNGTLKITIKCNVCRKINDIRIGNPTPLRFPSKI